MAMSACAPEAGELVNERRRHKIVFLAIRARSPAHKDQCAILAFL